jgi:hypothetical protein
MYLALVAVGRPYQNERSMGVQSLAGGFQYVRTAKTLVSGPAAADRASAAVLRRAQDKQGAPSTSKAEPSITRVLSAARSSLVAAITRKRSCPRIPGARNSSSADTGESHLRRSAELRGFLANQDLIESLDEHR